MFCQTPADKIAVKLTKYPEVTEWKRVTLSLAISIWRTTNLEQYMWRSEQEELGYRNLDLTC